MLFILRGIAGCGKSTLRKHFFPDHTVLASDDMRMELYGTMNANPSTTSLIWGELTRRLTMRMEQKMLTVFDATNLTQKSVKKLTRIADQWGCPFMIVSISPDLEMARNTMVRRGQGMIIGAVVSDEVLVDMQEKYHSHTPSLKTNYGDRFYEGSIAECAWLIDCTKQNLYHDLCYGDDIYIISDIHGHLAILKRLLAMIPPQAKIYSVGDIIDRGEDSMGCIMELMRDVRFRGFTMGNHEIAFLREREGKPINSKARRITHCEFDGLRDEQKESVLSFLSSGQPYLVLINPDLQSKVLLSHAGIGEYDPETLNLHHTVGDRINPVEEHTGSECFDLQVHGHSSWRYTGDFTGNVVNIDSCAYETGIMTAFNPFTGEVIQTNE